MKIEDMLAFVIITGITVGVLYFLSGKFLELKIFKEELIQSRDTIDMLQFLLTSSDLLINDEDGKKMRLMLNKTVLNNGEMVKKIVDEKSYPDYDYRLEIYSKADFSDKLFDFNFIYFNLESDCYQKYGIYYPITRDSSALLCEKSSNYFCEPVMVRLTTAKTPLSQMAAWISKLCSGYQNISFEKHIILNTSELVACTGGQTNCGIEYNTTHICLYLDSTGTGKQICKRYYCESSKVNVKRLLTQEEGCVDAILNRTVYKIGDQTFEDIIIQAPYVHQKP